MSPQEWLGVAVALLSFLGGALGWFVRNQLAPIRTIAEQTSVAMKVALETLDKLEDNHATHQQAGATWAKAMHRHLIDEGHRNPPDPNDYPGL